MRRKLALWLFAGIVGFCAFICTAMMVAHYVPPGAPFWMCAWPSGVQAAMVFTFALALSKWRGARVGAIVAVLGTASAWPWLLMALFNFDEIFHVSTLKLLPFAFGGYGFALGGAVLGKRFRREPIAQVPCPQCGYELVNLPEGSRCPECGEERGREGRS